jgi:diadenosine tetraphosphate (Ap4A) HIT family hydrolase
MSDCFLCTEMEERGGYISLSKHFRCVADIAPMRVGHCLLSTAIHKGSFAQLEVDVLREAVAQLAALCNLPLFSGRPVLYVEHGAVPGRGGESGIGCCDHAHIHLIPLDPLIERDALLKCMQSTFDREIASSALERVRRLPLLDVGVLGSFDYLWVGTDITKLDAFRVLRPERQLARRIVAGSLGTSVYRTWDTYSEELATDTTLILRNQIGPKESAFR